MARDSGLRRGNPRFQIHKLGGEMVNSVVINRFRDDQKSYDDEVVCVITNNDSTVRIYSLSRSHLLDALPFPTSMNHASISPDGQILVAVGDEPTAFFYKQIATPTACTYGEDGAVSCVWQKITEFELFPATLNDACFTTAFSLSGHICAVAQQSGIVTLFDTGMIHEEIENDDAVLDVLESSRASVSSDYIGAIRSMSFSPPPLTLLAWAEDRGRICVIDVRNPYRSRQTVDLDLDSPRLNRLNVTDLDLEECENTVEQKQLEIEPLLLQRQREAIFAQDHLATAASVTDCIEWSAGRRHESGVTTMGIGWHNDGRSL
ncbi:MAG: hypothetical protein Q9225_005342 [Loekoesia sp. 1 TL-2023]